jgi:hypothetical protein
MSAKVLRFTLAPIVTPPEIEERVADVAKSVALRRKRLHAYNPEISLRTALVLARMDAKANGSKKALRGPTSRIVLGARLAGAKPECMEDLVMLLHEGDLGCEVVLEGITALAEMIGYEVRPRAAEAAPSLPDALEELSEAGAALFADAARDVRARRVVEAIRQVIRPGVDAFRMKKAVR